MKTTVDTEVNTSTEREINMDNNQLVPGTYGQEFNTYTPRVFRNELFGDLTVFKDNHQNLYFIGLEVCNMLGYKNPNATLHNLIDERLKQSYDLRMLKSAYTNDICANDEQGVHLNSGYTNHIPALERFKFNPIVTLISEPALIELITRSNLKNNVISEFKKWMYNVTIDMRQYGTSISDQLDIDSMTNEELRSHLREAQHKISYYDRTMSDKENTLPLSSIAADLGISAQDLNHYLINKGILRKVGKSGMYILRDPYNDLGLAITQKCNYIDIDGQEKLGHYVVRYTEKGKEHIKSLLLNDLNDITSMRMQMRPNDYLQPSPQLMMQQPIQPQPQGFANPTVINNYNYYYNSPPPQTQETTPSNCPIEFVDRSTRFKYPTYEDYIKHHPQE